MDPEFINDMKEQELFKDYPNGLHGILKNDKGEMGFVSKICGQSEWIPVADGHDPIKARRIAESYYELRNNPMTPVDNGYINFVCRDVKSLAIPKVEK